MWRTSGMGRSVNLHETPFEVPMLPVPTDDLAHSLLLPLRRALRSAGRTRNPTFEETAMTEKGRPFAIVTGASTGIGYELARCCAHDGDRAGDGGAHCRRVLRDGWYGNVRM